MRSLLKSIFIYITGVLALFPLFVHAQGIEIKTGGSIAVTGSATIEISNGNFTNNGTYSKGTETVTISGNSAKTLSGSGSTDMYDLKISNTGGITTKLDLLNLNNLTIYSGSKLTIDTTRAVSVSNVVRNKATVNDLVIKSYPNAANGSLIFHNAQDSALLATVEMYCKASKPGSSYKWQFFGIPLRTMTVNPTFDGSYVRQFNEAGWNSGYTSDKHWIQLVNGNTMTPYTGYEVTQVNPTTFSFKGELINSDYASGKLPMTISAQYAGQHLIGNPYTAAIDIKKIEFGSARAAVIENTIYLYNTGSLSDWTTGGTGGAGESPGQYVGIPKILAGQNGIPGQIPSMQAFLISVSSNNDSATVTIPYSSTGAIVKNTTKQRIQTAPNTSTRIEVKGNRFTDKMWIFTNETCSKEFDNGWDALKFSGSSLSPQIYSMETSGDYQVNATNEINNTDIGFIAGEDTEYTLTFINENTESRYPHLYLKDLVTNSITDITASGTQYTFSSDQTGNPTSPRFKIITSLGVTTSTVDVSNSLNVFNSKKSIYINNNSNCKGELMIYDITGRFILKYPFNAAGQTIIATELPTGAYLMKATTSEKENIQRIMIQ